MRRYVWAICLSSFVFVGATGCTSSNNQNEGDSATSTKNGDEDDSAEKQAQIDELETRVQKLEAQLERERRLAERRESLRKQLETELADLVDAGKIEITTRRGRLVVRLPHNVLFTSGKFELRKRGQKALESVSSALGELEKHRVLVAGYTDDVPVSDKNVDFENNWELSAMRALSAAVVLEKAGLSSEKIGAAGFGAHDPIAKNDSKENRQKNRRVELILEPDLSGVVERTESQGEMQKN